MKTERIPMTGELVELAACPFCPVKPPLTTQRIVVEIPRRGWAVRCIECGTTGPLCERSEQAIPAWNTRAPTDSVLREAAFEVEEWLRDMPINFPFPIEGRKCADLLRTALSSTPTPGGMTGEQKQASISAEAGLDGEIRGAGRFLRKAFPEIFAPTPEA